MSINILLASGRGWPHGKPSPLTKHGGAPTAPVESAACPPHDAESVAQPWTKRVFSANLIEGLSYRRYSLRYVLFGVRRAYCGAKPGGALRPGLRPYRLNEYPGLKEPPAQCHRLLSPSDR